ncbi:MAG: hypothetical protein IJU65_03620 [Desulfovibrio sp.]|nr:hypothetical protein [Desulfovibrio sp.]
MAQVTLHHPYVTRYPSLDKLLWRTRFVVVVAHRRFGKTTVALNHLIQVAGLCKERNARCGYIAPLRTQAKAIAWKELKRWTDIIPGRVVNESELYVEFPQSIGGTASVRLFGADNPDALRGQYFDYVVMDEVAQMRPETWEEVVRPTLSDRHGGALFIGTPKGINLFQELFDKASRFEAAGDTEWAARSYPVTVTKALPEKEIADTKKEMSEKAFRQEYLCDFTASSDDTLISLDEVNMAMRDADMDMDTVMQWPLVVGVDVGRSSDPTVIFARRGRYTFEPIIWRDLDTVEQAHRLLAYIRERKPAYMCIDVGFNPGLYDMLVDLHRHQASDTVLAAINFSSKPNHIKYRNKRVEIWIAVRDWLRNGGKLHPNDTLKAELTSPTTWQDEAERICLEPKEALKKRLGHSTDLADALALTFAVPIGLDPDSIFPELEERYGQRAARKTREFILCDDQVQERWNPFGGQPEYD